MEIEIKIDDIYKKYDTNAKFIYLDNYMADALVIAGEGNIITLTGGGPIWLYLKIAHALHGKASKLYYHSPANKNGLNEDLKIMIFDHDAGPIFKQP